TVYSQKIKQPEGRFSEEIDISKSGSGTYFLQITQGDKAQTKKVVIQ
ncbi:MAG: T9SS type A sorting domain-containing protein, partial [Flavobacteriales bacterium]|nr:T9SS type A sorting domain-containing protein [Flavobacteriales bacterium]